MRRDRELVAVVSIFALVMFVALALPTTSAAGLLEDHDARKAAPRPAPAEVNPEDLDLLPGPGIEEDYFPCSDCHDPTDDVDYEHHELDEHEKQKGLVHGTSTLWCFDCHEGPDRDMLHTASGKLMPLLDSHKLCGQCHGEIYQEWKVGVHGKRIGSWSGAKQYYRCVSCHDPHSPRFKARKPLPPPLHPYDVDPRAATESHAAPTPSDEPEAHP